MATCTSCGNDVTGKKFCQNCGTPVQVTGVSANNTPSTKICPRCNGEVKANAAFCMHCGSSLSAQNIASTASSQASTRNCPACRTEAPVQQAFCSNCGQNMQATPSGVSMNKFCTNCGTQNAPGVRFCANCGNQLMDASVPAPTPTPGTGYQSGPQYPPQTGQYPPSQYGQPDPQYNQVQPQYGQPGYGQPQPQYGQPTYGQPQPQYGQPQYPQQPYPQTQYPQQPYPQQGYQPQPMMGQQPMVLRCPVCMAMSPLGTPNCPSCHTSLAGIVPTPANMPPQGQQGGLGGMLQGNGGKYAMGALGGAAAVIGGEMLLHGIENTIENRVEGDMGYGYEGERHHHHHHREEGMLGGLGDLANDIGLF